MTEISEGVISSLKSEYLSILILIVAWILINAAAIWFADKKKLGFGIAVIFAYVRFFGTIAAVVILCVIRPIWILVRDRSEFLNVKPVILCVLCITALLLPAVISVFVLLFGKKIMDTRERTCIRWNLPIISLQGISKGSWMPGDFSIVMIISRC